MCISRQHCNERLKMPRPGKSHDIEGMREVSCEFGKDDLWSDSN